MGQCISLSCFAAQDASEGVSPKPVPERVERKKRGRVFRWAFSRKSKKTINEAQQSPCRNDCSQLPQRCFDGEAEEKRNTQSINTPSNNVPLDEAEENSDSSSESSDSSSESSESSSENSWHSCASSFAAVQKVDVPRQEQEGINPSNTSPTVSYMTGENKGTAVTMDTFSWKTEDEIIHLSSKAKREDIKQHYNIGRILGEGGYGRVYEATRLSDSRKVALKYVLRRECRHTVQPGRHGKPLPNEVAMMIQLSKGPNCPEIIKLLDWYKTFRSYILVIERPTPCKDLRQFLMQCGGRLRESEACVVMRQVVTAATVCCERGVFHSDIKLENLLINENTLQVKLIDFGVSRYLMDSAYSKFIGTKVFAPPEALQRNYRYHAKPATVYSLGVLLFLMLIGKYPSKVEPLLFPKILETANISKKCRDLIYSCMEKDPAKRIDLEKILLHDWFQESSCTRKKIDMYIDANAICKSPWTAYMTFRKEENIYLYI